MGFKPVASSKTAVTLLPVDVPKTWISVEVAVDSEVIAGPSSSIIRNLLIVLPPLFPERSEALTKIVFTPCVLGFNSICHLHALTPSEGEVHDAPTFFKLCPGLRSDKSAVTELKLRSFPDMLTITSASTLFEENELMLRLLLKILNVFGSTTGPVMSTSKVTEVSSDNWPNLSVAFAKTEFIPSLNILESVDIADAMLQPSVAGSTFCLKTPFKV